jgi:hypothetical protein
MWRRFWALGLVWLSASGCGGNVVVDHGGAGGSGQGGAGGGSSGNVCVQAQKFIAKCASASVTTGSGTVDCTGALECQAQCVLHATCGAFDGMDPAASMALASCLTACSGG